MFSTHRSHTLAAKKFRQLAIPNAFASLVKVLLICGDSFVAGHFLGMPALEVMALAVPFLVIDEMLNCLLGQGIIIQVSQNAGKGDRIAINRMIGAVLPAVLLIYSVVLIPTILYSENLVRTMTNDPELVKQTLQYIVPLMIGMPFFEMCLCLERAYQIDGRVKLFVTRPIISGVLNIVLDYLFVAVFHKGIGAIAIASLISTAVGYCVTLSHGFSKKCTVKPDFSIIKNLRECWEYLKCGIVYGGSSAIDEGTRGFVSKLVCSLLVSASGSGALAIWEIFSLIMDILFAGTFGIGNGIKLLGGILFGEEDYAGTKIIEKKGLTLSTCYGAIVTVLVALFIPSIARAYGIEEGSITLCTKVIRIAIPGFFAYALFNNFEIYFTLVKQFKLSYAVLIITKLLMVCFALFGARLGVMGIFTGYSASYVVALLGIIVILVRNGAWLLPKEKYCGFTDYSITLEKETIVKVSTDVQRLTVQNGYSLKTAMWLSLLMEDGLNLIRIKNEDVRVNADIRVSVKEKKLVIVIMDNGTPYSISDFIDFDFSPGTMEQHILRKISTKIQYDRILEMNHLVLKLSSEEYGIYTQKEGNHLNRLVPAASFCHQIQCLTYRNLSATDVAFT